jgi:CRISPR-associated protein Cas2
MRRFDFILTYDISDHKRLRKIAKIVEKKAIRIQYSVYFLHEMTKDEVTSLLSEVTKIFDEKNDDIRVYRIKNYGIHMGKALNLSEPFDFF